MYHQPCSMTNYICEMRLCGGLPSQSLLLGYVYRFQQEVLHCVSVLAREREECHLVLELADINPVNFFLLSFYINHKTLSSAKNSSFVAITQFVVSLWS